MKCRAICPAFQHLAVFLCGFITFTIWGCNNQSSESQKQDEAREETTSIQTSTSHTADKAIKPEPEPETPIETSLPKPKPVKKPEGIYRAIVPLKDSKAEQIVAFYKDYTYQLQERYTVHDKDTTTITKGNWMPSDGYIWLYKDQIALARYLWKGDTLEYFNTATKKNVSMHPLLNALQNDSLNKLKAAGIVLKGMGNEPFWSVEVNAQDSISFRLADWQQPVKMKIDSVKRSNDSTFYTATRDSLHLKVMVLPYFCMDGMSGKVFANKYRVEFNQRVFSGCGL